MSIQDIGIWILGGLFSLGAIAGGFGFLISQYQDGESKTGTDKLNSSKTLVEYLQTQNDGFAKALIELRQQISDQNVVIGKLQTTINERDKQLAEYKAIFTGTDSATKQFQKTLLDNIQAQVEFRKTANEAFTQLLQGQSNAKDKASLPINISGQITQ
jgi:hypothetical protein